MSHEMDFFIYLLESYAADTGQISRDVLRKWNQHKITSKIYDSWWEYHQERIENAYCDIECLMETGEHADLHPEYWERY